jgi:hypothetical protein
MPDASSHSWMKEQIGAERQLPLHRLSRICVFARTETQRKRMAAIEIPLFPAAIDFDGPSVVQRIFLASRNGLKDRLINIGSWAIVSAMLHLPRQHWPSS